MLDIQMSTVIEVRIKVRDITYKILGVVDNLEIGKKFLIVHIRRYVIS